jgi:hypothetical protein
MRATSTAALPVLRLPAASAKADTEAPAVQAHAFALRQKRAATAHQELRCVAVPTRALCQRVSLQSAR